MDRVRGAKAAQTHNQTGKIKRDSSEDLKRFRLHNKRFIDENSLIFLEGMIGPTKRMIILSSFLFTQV